MNTDRDTWSWAGIWIVGATAAVWSFSSLSDLAVLVGITETIAWGLVHVSWGLPLTVDVLAVVATRVWLRGVAPVPAVEYARTLSWSAIGASIVGNAYHGWLSDGRIDAVIISAVPACVLGVLVHLAVLIGRQERVTAWDAKGQPELAPFVAMLEDETAKLATATEPVPQPIREAVREVVELGREVQMDMAPVFDAPKVGRPARHRKPALDDVTRARYERVVDDTEALMADRVKAAKSLGLGRDRVVERLGIGPSEAKRLLREAGR